MLENILISFLSSIFGVVLALIVDRKKYPKIEIVASEDANSDNTYPAGERWKFFRVKVTNKMLPWWSRWLMVRQTAESCRASVMVDGINNNIHFAFQGRWASTPELPSLVTDQALLKVSYPDPVSIGENKSEILDIFVKNNLDCEAYGWNNESYFYKWRNVNYKLLPGKYKLRVVIYTQNGISATQEFEIIIEETIERSSIINKLKNN